MKTCKYCQAELKEDSKFCASCGKPVTDEELTAEETVTEAAETAEEIAATEAAEVVENTEEVPRAAEIREGRKATPGTIALIVGAVVLVIAIIVALVSGGLSSKEEQSDTIPESTDEIMEIVPGTIPPDGDPDNETCKGSYTVSDEEVIAARDVIVATMGEKELTNAQLQLYYWLEVQSFLGNYGSYASMFGLDYTQPLDTQICGIAEEGTWQQFFLKSAMQSWQNYQAMVNEAEQAGFQLDAETLAILDKMPEDLKATAEAGGFADVESMVGYNVGAGANLEDYLEFMRHYYLGYMYFEDLSSKIQPTDEEIEAYFTEHEDTYAEGGITRDAKTVDVRHILIMPEGATNENIRTETFSEEAWAASEKKAQEILDAWKAGEKTEASFAELAKTESQDGSSIDGGLYTEVTKGQMVQNFDAWCFDDSRVYGDNGIVKTEFGYHIMYFVGSTPVDWKPYVESDLISQRSNELLDEIINKYPIEVDYSFVKLGFVSMAG